MQQDRIASNIFTMRLAIVVPIDGDNRSKLCPVFRVNGRPPIDGFTVEKVVHPTLWLANQPRTDADATQDRASALADSRVRGI